MSGGRWAAHRSWRFTSSFMGAVILANSARPSGVRQRSASVSSGMISSRTKVRIQSSFASNSGSVEKSQAMRPSSGVVVELQSRAVPLHGVEVAVTRGGDVGGLQVRAAEADVRDEYVVLRHLDLVDHLTLRADDTDGADDEGGDADVALAVD